MSIIGDDELVDITLTKRTLTIDLAELGFQEEDIPELAGVECTLTGPGGMSILTDGTNNQIVLPTSGEEDTGADGIASFLLVPSEHFLPDWPRVYTLTVGNLSPIVFNMPDADITFLSLILNNVTPPGGAITEPNVYGWIASSSAPPDPLAYIGWWNTQRNVLSVWDGLTWRPIAGGAQTDQVVAAALEHLDDVTADLTPGEHHSGWADTTMASQGGIAVRSSGGVYDLSAARAATNWAVKDDGTANDNWVVRVPAPLRPYSDSRSSCFRQWY